MKEHLTIQESLDIGRQPCTVYTRVMGYYSAIKTAEVNPAGVFSGSMNTGKRSEAMSREYFDYEKTMASLDACAANSEFCDKF